MTANQAVVGESQKEGGSTQSEEEIISSYVKMCSHVRKGCNFDISKCFIDGKPLIIEGSLIDPNSFVKFVTNEEDGT